MADPEPFQFCAGTGPFGPVAALFGVNAGMTGAEAAVIGEIPSGVIAARTGTGAPRIDGLSAGVGVA